MITTLYIPRALTLEKSKF